MENLSMTVSASQYCTSIPATENLHGADVMTTDYREAAVETQPYITIEPEVA